MTKVTKATKATETKAYEEDVVLVHHQIMQVVNTLYPYAQDGSMSYARQSYVDGMIRQAEFDLNAAGNVSKNGKVYGSIPMLKQAQLDYEDACYLAERRGEDTDDNKVYYTKVERTRDWLNRMEMQNHGNLMRLDALFMVREALANQ